MQHLLLLRKSKSKFCSKELEQKQNSVLLSKKRAPEDSGKNEKSSAKVKRATKNSSFCYSKVLGKNQKSWAKVKRADQKWKELPKKQNLPKLHFGQKSKELTKSEKSSPKVKRATRKAKSAKITFWAKIKRADQKWKELTKSEMNYQKSKIC